LTLSGTAPNTVINLTHTSVYAGGLSTIYLNPLFIYSVYASAASTSITNLIYNTYYLAANNSCSTSTTLTYTLKLPAGSYNGANGAMGTSPINLTPSAGTGGNYLLCRLGLMFDSRLT
jgi:hypothetical protein